MWFLLIYGLCFYINYYVCQTRHCIIFHLIHWVFLLSYYKLCIFLPCEVDTANRNTDIDCDCIAGFLLNRLVLEEHSLCLLQLNITGAWCVCHLFISFRAFCEFEFEDVRKLSAELCGRIHPQVMFSSQSPSTLEFYRKDIHENNLGFIYISVWVFLYIVLYTTLFGCKPVAPNL